MMLPQDSLLLALTKLKTRRIRLGVTVVIAGLMFVLFATTSLVINGAFTSIESFSNEGLGKRYMTQVTSVGYDDMFSLAYDEALVKEVKTAFEKLKKDKASTAKDLGIFYDPATEPSPIILGGPKGEDQEVVDISSPIVIKLFNARAKESSKKYYEQVAKAQENYDVVGQYGSVTVGGASYMSNVGSQNKFSLITDGVESSQDPALVDEFYSYGPPRGLEGIVNGVTIMSDELLLSFTLQGESLDVKDGVIPIVVPYSAAEEVLSLQPLPAGTDAEEQLDRIKEVRTNISGKTFEVCVRNQASQERQQTALTQTKEYNENKDKKDYFRPELQYGVSDTPCEDVVVVRDVRSAYQKKQDKAQETFDQLYGAQKPEQRILSFRIVGVTSDPPSYASFNITDLLSGLLTSYIGSGWFIPLSSVPEALPEFNEFAERIGSSVEYDYGTYIEFASAEETRRFIREASCEPEFNMISTDQNPFQSCIDEGKPFFVSSYGSSSVALEEARGIFFRIFSTVILIGAGISALILMGTVGKIIADSRRETAVFRAIGAKRLDIAQIYITYTLLVATLLTLFTAICSVLIALYVDHRYSSDFTVQALVNYNANDLNKKFELIGFNATQLGLLILVIFGASLLAALIPLLTNLRRNPIRDMRDER